MSRALPRWLVLGFLLLVFPVSFLGGAAPEPAPAAASQRSGKALGSGVRPLNLPLAFEPNVGQAASDVQFVAPNQGLLVTSEGIVLTLVKRAEEPGLPLQRGRTPLKERKFQTAVVRMRFNGGNPMVQAVGREELPSRSHYFLGNDAQKWRTQIPHYGRVELAEVYPGINVALYGNQGQLEYDLVLAPGADPRAVRLEFEGVEGIRTEAGELVMTTSLGEIRQPRPVLYQVGAGGTREPVSGEYVLKGSREVGFKVGAHSRHRSLVIDPVLKYSTLVGTSDLAFGVAADGGGNAYVTGQALTGAIAGTVLGGVFDRSNPFPGPGYLAKIDPQGGLVYFAYLGGNCAEIGYGIAVDGVGNAYLAGVTCSIDFPVVHGFRTQYGDGVPSTFHSGNALETGFFAKVSPDGSGLLYSTYLGGSISTFGEPFSVDDIAFGVAVDGAGNAYVTGETDSADFPTTPNAFQGSHPGGPGGDAAFVTKLNPAVSGADSVVYSTFFGGTIGTGAHGVAVDGAGNAYITGITNSPNLPPPVVSPPTRNAAGLVSEGFLAKLDPSGSASLYSTYLGGTGGFDAGAGVALDPSGNVHVAGITNSSDFPISTLALPPLPTFSTPGLFWAKFDPRGVFLHSTVFGGFGGFALGGAGPGVAVDAAGNSFVTASNRIQNFTEAGTESLVAKLASGGTPVWSQRLPGLISKAIALDATGGVYVAGFTTSSVGPTFLRGRSAFVARLQDDTSVNLVISNTTTRWKALKDTTTPIVVNFTGPSELRPAPATTLQITDPNGNTIASPNLAFAGSGGTYTITWSGPWITDPRNPASFLPRGDYQILVKGTKTNGGPITSDSKDPNSTVSLVEVKNVRFMPVEGAPSLDDNPAVSGVPGDAAYRTRPKAGKRILSEALLSADVDPNATVYDRVYVIADIDPPVGKNANPGAVQVFFRSLDVADPAGPSVSPATTGVPVFQDNRANRWLRFPNPPLAIAAEGMLLALNQDGTASEVAGGAPGGILQQVPMPGTSDRPVCPGQGGSPNADAPIPGCQAKTTLHVSRSPGDNYRIAASTSSTWLTGVSAVPNTISNGNATNQTGQVVHSSGQTLVDQQTGDPISGPQGERQVSDMLTVWRTLHLEVARLASSDPEGDQAALDIRGTFGSISANVIVDPSLRPIPADGSMVGANLSLAFHATDWYNVTANREVGGSNPGFQIRTGTPALTDPYRLTTPQPTVNLLGGMRDQDIKNRGYTLRDNLISSLDPAAPCGPTPCQADHSLADQLLAEAYIQVVRVGTIPGQPEPPPGLIPLGLASADSFAHVCEESRRQPECHDAKYFPAQIKGSESYWSTLLVSAFNGDPKADLDPQTEGFNLGVTHIGGSDAADFSACDVGFCKPKSAVFMETIRDLFEKPSRAVQPRQNAPLEDLRLSSEVNRRVTAHEMLHGFQLIHNGNNIMCGGVNVSARHDPIGGTINDAQLATVRGVKQPSQAPEFNNTCP